MNDQPKARETEEQGPLTAQAEETLVADPRGEWTPSQLVERKLVTLLRATPLPVSQVLSGRYTGR